LPEPATFALSPVLAVAFAHARYMSRAGGFCHGFRGGRAQIRRFAVDLQGDGPDKRGPFRVALY
jgi:hypothetical protein